MCPNCGDDPKFAVNPDDDTETDVLAIEIRWEQDDLGLLETNPLTYEPIKTTEAITTTEPGGRVVTNKHAGPAGTSGPSDDDGSAETGRRQDDDESEAASMGVSRGEVVGIAIGVAVAAILICAAAFILYRRRHLKSPTNLGTYTVNGENTGFGASPPGLLQGVGVSRKDLTTATGVPATPVAELCGQTISFQQPCAQETSHGISACELDGTNVGPQQVTWANFLAGAEVSGLHDTRRAWGRGPSGGEDYSVAAGGNTS